jgi:hypothetical protein
MCYRCQYDEEEYGFSPAECYAAMDAADEQDAAESAIMAQDEMEARGGPYYLILNDVIPF